MIDAFRFLDFGAMSHDLILEKAPIFRRARFGGGSVDVRKSRNDVGAIACFKAETFNS